VRRFPRRGRQAGERSGRKAASVNKNPQARRAGQRKGLQWWWWWPGVRGPWSRRGPRAGEGPAFSPQFPLSQRGVDTFDRTRKWVGGPGFPPPPAQLGGAASSVVLAVSAKMKWTRWAASSQITCPPPPTCSDISPADHRCQRRRAGKNGGGLAAAAAAVRVYRWVITSIVTIHLPLPYTVGSCACCAIQKMDPMLYSQFKRYD
jgi:hypothetical protein